MRPSMSTGKHLSGGDGNTRQNLTELHAASHSLVFVVDVEAQRGRFGGGPPVERFTSGALIADAHCNLSISSLFTSLFSFFLDYLKCYLSNNEISKEQKKKKLNLSFLCIMAYVEFFEEKENVLCVLSLSVP